MSQQATGPRLPGPATHGKEGVRLDAPGERVTTRYRICVKGRLDASWSDRMAGLSITTDRDLDGAVHPCLTFTITVQRR